MEFSGSKSFRYSVSLAETQPFPNQINRFSQIKDLALHHALSRQRFMVVILIHYTILVRGSQIEVTITVLNVRCRPLNRNEEQCSSTNKFVAERVFPSRIHISLIPPQEFLRHIKGLELTHSQRNPIATVTVGQGSQISANTRGRLEFSASTNRTVAMANDAWRVEQKEEGMSNNKNACLYIGALDFCMYHPVSGLEIISCKPKHGDSWLKKSYKSVNSPLDKEGGISFTQQDCGKEFKWVFCRPPDLDLDTNNLTMQWDLSVKLWAYKAVTIQDL